MVSHLTAPDYSNPSSSSAIFEPRVHNTEIHLTRNYSERRRKLNWKNWSVPFRPIVSCLIFHDFSLALPLFLSGSRVVPPQRTWFKNLPDRLYIVPRRVQRINSVRRIRRLTLTHGQVLRNRELDLESRFRKRAGGSARVGITFMSEDIARER